MFVSLRRTQAWRLHTKLSKFGRHTSANNARMKNGRCLILSEVAYIYPSIIYRIPDSWLYSLNGYNFSFDHMTGENLESNYEKFKFKYSYNWYYDENRIFPIEAILKHKQVVCMRRKELFTTFKYLFSFQRYLASYADVLRLGEDRVPNLRTPG